MDEHRTVAAQIGGRLHNFECGLVEGSVISDELSAATDELFRTMSVIKPYEENKEVRAIWIFVPRGSITDFDDYQEAKESGDVETCKDLEETWRYDYPTDPMWYEVVIYDVRDRDGNPMYKGVRVDGHMVVAAELAGRCGDRCGRSWTEQASLEVLSFLSEPLWRSLEMVRDGTYNAFVEAELPFFHRTGVIRLCDLWSVIPGYRSNLFEEFPEAIFSRLQELVDGGENCPERIGRIERFTANDFFCACSIGYKACGYDVRTPGFASGKELGENGELSPKDQYLKFADGRDEGLAGSIYDDREAGIDPDDPAAWEEWYFHRGRTGGHPWEVSRGGSSTRIDLFVCNDRDGSGFYLCVSGRSWGRSVEAVKFYVAIHDAGYPVYLMDGEDMLRRFRGDVNVGIVPHDVFPRYCEGMFPKRFGRIMDFIHVDEEDVEKLGDAIEWLPEHQVELADL